MKIKSISICLLLFFTVCGTILNGSSYPKKKVKIAFYSINDNSKTGKSKESPTYSMVFKKRAEALASSKDLVFGVVDAFEAKKKIDALKDTEIEAVYFVGHGNVDGYSFNHKAGLETSLFVSNASKATDNLLKSIVSKSSSKLKIEFQACGSGKITKKIAKSLEKFSLMDATVSGITDLDRYSVDAQGNITQTTPNLSIIIEKGKVQHAILDGDKVPTDEFFW
jgi:hypothetical protein